MLKVYFFFFQSSLLFSIPSRIKYIRASFSIHFLVSLQHYLNYSLYQTIPPGVVNGAIYSVIYENPFILCIVLGKVFANGLRVLLSTLRISAIVDSISCRGFIPTFFSRTKIREQGNRGLYTASSGFSVNRNPDRKDLHFLRYFFESNFLSF